MKASIIHFSLILFIAALISPAASAATGDDLVNCRFKNGIQMDPKVCGVLRRGVAEDNAIKERQERQLAEQRQRESDRQAANKAAAEERGRVDAERRAKKDIERAAQEKLEAAERATEDRAERAYEKKRAAAVSEKKHICGEDYGNPKIGMTVDRAQQCVAKFKLISQLNRADGIISTYAGGGFYLNVMGGRIVSWRR